jgi:hypothetical protein
MDNYTVTDEDISILTKQITVTPDRARELLAKHNGDHVAAITEFFSVKVPVCDRVDIGVNSGHRVEAPLPTHVDVTGLSEATRFAPLMNVMNQSSHPANLNSKTYVVIELSENSANFTKKKSYGTLLEVLTRYRASFGAGVDGELINLLPIQGKLLDQWCIVHGGIALSANQLVTNQWIVENMAFDRINKSATLFARTSGLIKESESIIGRTLLINNVEFDLEPTTLG